MCLFNFMVPLLVELSLKYLRCSQANSHSATTSDPIKREQRVCSLHWTSHNQPSKCCGMSGKNRGGGEGYSCNFQNAGCKLPVTWKFPCKYWLEQCNDNRLSVSVFEAVKRHFKGSINDGVLPPLNFYVPFLNDSRDFVREKEIGGGSVFQWCNMESRKLKRKLSGIAHTNVTYKLGILNVRTSKTQRSFAPVIGVTFHLPRNSASH